MNISTEGTGSNEIDALINATHVAHYLSGSLCTCDGYTPAEQAAGEKHAVECGAALCTAIAAVVKDAERYRWLKERAYCDSREQFVDGFNVAGEPGGYAEFADESVDAAISAGKQGEGDE